MTTCWMIGHDYEVIEEFCHSWGDGIEIPYNIKVCLRCKQIVDEITPVKERIEAIRFRRKSRAEQARQIYDERHKHG